MDTIKTIYRKYLSNSCSEAEYEVLLAFFSEKENEKQIVDILDEVFQNSISKDQHGVQEKIVDKNRLVLNKIITVKTHQQRTTKTITTLQRYAIAAAIALLSFFLSLSLYRLYEPKIDENLTLQRGNHYGASLLLENGKEYKLDTGETNIINDGTSIRYLDGIEITELNTVQNLILKTPRAGQYQIQLPDGSNVWLNAESSIRYPSQFLSSERRVELVGEAYFEVKNDPTRPFIVETRYQKTEVKGTKFNIEAYPFESNSVTLTEGKVLVLPNGKNKQAIPLIPGDRVVIDQENTLLVNDVDITAYTAWKDGFIILNNANLDEVLLKLERCYDVRFEHIPTPKEQKNIAGSLSRDLSIVDILVVLEKQYNIKFKPKGRRTYEVNTP